MGLGSLTGAGVPPAGILEVLYCVLIESPEVLNIIQENHIKSIISLLDKHGRNHKVRRGPLLWGGGGGGMHTCVQMCAGVSVCRVPSLPGAGRALLPLRLQRRGCPLQPEPHHREPPAPAGPAAPDRAGQLCHQVGGGSLVGLGGLGCSWGSWEVLEDHEVLLEDLELFLVGSWRGSGCPQDGPVGLGVLLWDLGCSWGNWGAPGGIGGVLEHPGVLLAAHGMLLYSWGAPGGSWGPLDCF